MRLKGMAWEKEKRETKRKEVSARKRGWLR